MPDILEQFALMGSVSPRHRCRECVGILPWPDRTRYIGAMREYIQVVTTTEHREDAESIARALVDERLAACVQVIGPISSIYRWQGAIQTAQEWQCWAKSRRDLYDQVEEAIRRLHPYEVPEILAVPVLAGSASYLAWLDGEVKTGGESS
jgi:periplasmic divalent cation tolerance protein